MKAIIWIFCTWRTYTKGGIPIFPSITKIEDQYKSGPSSRLPSAVNAGTTGKKKALNMVQVRHQQDSMKPTGKNTHSSRSNCPKDEGLFLMELSGCNPKRQEFRLEYDNDAEHLLADI